VHAGVTDREVKVIVLRGAGRAFCAGFDFGEGFHHWDDFLTSGDEWDPGRDFVVATTPRLGPIPTFMSLWRSPKPVIACAQAAAVGH
jgi:enoyl-CoA hydratase